MRVPDPVGVVERGPCSAPLIPSVLQRDAPLRRGRLLRRSCYPATDPAVTAGRCDARLGHGSLTTQRRRWSYGILEAGAAVQHARRRVFHIALTSMRCALHVALTLMLLHDEFPIYVATQ